MIYKYNSPRIAAFLPSMIGIAIIDSIIFLSHCPTKLFIQQLSSSQRQGRVYLFAGGKKIAFEKHSLIAQTEPRVYMTWYKVLMIEGGKKWSQNRSTS